MHHYAYCVESTFGFSEGEIYEIKFPSSNPYGHTTFLTKNDFDLDDRIYYANRLNFIIVLNTAKSKDEMKAIFDSIMY